MCGRLVNLDTVARVLADYYHLKTDTQLAALNEALSRVPAETVGKELFGNSEQLEKDHVADPGNMVGDTISRAAAINAICEDGTRLERQGKYTMTMAERKQRDADILDALPSAQPEIIRCKDCKYARLTYDGSCKYCDVWFPDEAEYMDGDYYCASAERKSNG